MRRPQECAPTELSQVAKYTSPHPTTSHGGFSSSPQELDPMEYLLDAAIAAAQQVEDDPEDFIEKDASEVLNELQSDADAAFGHSISELLEVEASANLGVPRFIRRLCSFIIINGVDFDTLVSDTCDFGVQLPAESNEEIEKNVAILLQRLMRQLSIQVSESVLGVFEALAFELECSRSEIVSDVIGRKVLLELKKRLLGPDFGFVRYFTCFLVQIGKRNTSVGPQALSVLLARVFSDQEIQEGAVQMDRKTKRALGLAEMLVLNHEVIFRQIDPLLAHDTECNSDKLGDCHCHYIVPETSESKELGTPEEAKSSGIKSPESEGSLLSLSSPTSSTSSDFSPQKISPLAEGESALDFFKSIYSSPVTRDPLAPKRTAKESTTSSAELSLGDALVSKAIPFGKEYFPSITGLVSSSTYDSYAPQEYGRQDVGLQRPSPDDDSASSFSGTSGTSGTSAISSSSDSDGIDEDRSDRNVTRQKEAEAEEMRNLERFSLTSPFSDSSKYKSKSKRKVKHKKKGYSRSRRPETSEEEKPEPFVPQEPEVVVEGARALSPPREQSPFLQALVGSNEEDPRTCERSLWWERREQGREQEGERMEALDMKRTEPVYNREEEISTALIWFRADTAEPTAAAAAAVDGYGISSRCQRMSVTADAAIRRFMKQKSEFKKKIKELEDDFQSRFGYRPSHSDKMKNKDGKKFLTFISRLKKDIQSIKDDFPRDQRRYINIPIASSCAKEPSRESVIAPTRVITPPPPAEEGEAPARQLLFLEGTNYTKQETMALIQKRLAEERQEVNRPHDVTLMTLEELKQDKSDMQKALLFFESFHGHPTSKEDAQLVRPLYDRYRKVKRTIQNKSQDKDLLPIIEHEEMHFTSPSPQHRGSLDSAMAARAAIQSTSLEFAPIDRVDTSTTSPSIDGSDDDEDSDSDSRSNMSDLHALPLDELKERKREAREEKKKLRGALRDVEIKFERETGRKMQKEDRGHMQDTYNNYKHAKAKCRLLDALISKHD